VGFAARINSASVKITLLVFITFCVANNFIGQESKSGSIMHVPGTCIQSMFER
jgi:hypothetical protein